MAISVIHNPSDNKLRGLVQMLTSRFLQRGAVDLCGVKSGREVDKFALCGLTAVPAAGVSAPAVEECPVRFSCKVKSVTPLGTHDLFLAEIVSIEADEALFEENGRLALEKADLLAYSHGEYYTLGKKVGSFGFSVRKKKKRRKG